MTTPFLVYDASSGAVPECHTVSGAGVAAELAALQAAATHFAGLNEVAPASTPIPAVHVVVRRRLFDLREEFQISITRQTRSSELHHLGQAQSPAQLPGRAGASVCCRIQWLKTNPQLQAHVC